MNAQERRRAAMLQPGRLESIASRSAPGPEATSPSRKVSRTTGLSPVFSSAPPAGLVQLSAASRRAAGGGGGGTGTSSSPSLSSSSDAHKSDASVNVGPNSNVTNNSNTNSTANAVPGSGVNSSATASTLLQNTVAKHRRLIIFFESVVLGLAFGAQPQPAPWLLYWALVTALLVSVAWWAELSKMVRQLWASKTIGVGVVLLLQQAPIAQAICVEWLDAFAVFLICFVFVK